MAYCLALHPGKVTKSFLIQDLKRRNQRRVKMITSCLRGEPSDRESSSGSQEKKQIKEEKIPRSLTARLDEVGRAWKENWSPKRKGDLKDVVLMSLSFAIYIYISQQLVCAYCTWVSMVKAW